MNLRIVEIPELIDNENSSVTNIEGGLQCILL